MPDDQINERVTYDSILNQIHQRYAKQTASLIQENAEQGALLVQISSERDELKTKLEAMTG